MPAEGNGCKMYRRTAMRTASPPIRSTITSSCLCPRAGIASRKPGFTALDSGFRTYAASNLLHERLLVAHHLPFPISIRPKLADEHPSEPRGRPLGKLHGALIRDERVVRPEGLHLEELQQIIAKHAVFHFSQYVRLGALSVAILFHSFEIIGQKCGIAVLVSFLIRRPRGFHFRLQHLGQFGLSAGVLGW